jgi:hypothetical protein
MKKNVASQKIGAEMVSSLDGTNFSGTVTVYVTGDAGTQSLGATASGVCTNKGNGYYTYAPSQAETNYDLIAFTFTGTNAVSSTVQVYTDFPQTGDSFAVLPTANGNADALLDRTDAIETGWTLRQVLKIIAAACAGKAHGLDLGTPVYRSLTDTKDRISATTDQYGNRSAVTLDVT